MEEQRPKKLSDQVRDAIADGHDFIPDAIRQGAVAVGGERA
jgi:UDP-N-acetylmuramyl tripeptide synthase